MVRVRETYQGSRTSDSPRLTPRMGAMPASTRRIGAKCNKEIGTVVKVISVEPK